MANQDTFRPLLILELKELHHAESQLCAALPGFASSSTDPALKTCLTRHVELTRNHLDRLDQVLDLVGASPRGRACHAVSNLIRDGRAIPNSSTTEIHDARLIAVLQKIKHHQICGYGTARTLAYILALDEASNLLAETLREISATDQSLTNLAVALYTGPQFEQGPALVSRIAVGF